MTPQDDTMADFISDMKKALADADEFAKETPPTGWGEDWRVYEARRQLRLRNIEELEYRLKGLFPYL